MGNRSAVALAILSAFALSACVNPNPGPMFGPPPPDFNPNLIVARTKGVDLKAGEVIDGTLPLRLAAGQKLTLIEPDGKTIRLTGPYEGTPWPWVPVSPLSDQVKALISAQGAERAKLGISHGAPYLPAPPEPWMADVHRSGDHCLEPDATRLVFWTRAMPKNPKGNIGLANNKVLVDFVWPAGADRAELPLDPRSIGNGETLLFDFDGGTARIVFHRFPPSVNTMPVRVAWMIEYGCVNQAAQLLRAARSQP